jgi:ACS family hexuronate transporter-like MFS transporter
VAWTTLHSGWRLTFLLIGEVGLLLLPPWLWVHRHGTGTEGAPGTAPVEGCAPAAGVSSADVTLGEVLRTRKYWLVVAARGCSDIAWFFYLFWIPAYFQDVRGLSLARVGKLLWIPYFCSFIGALAGAAASGALIRKGWGVSRSRKTVLLAAAFLAAISACAGFASLTVLALALVSLALFSHQIWSTNIHTAITEISPSKHVAILYGISGAGGTFVGAGAQLVIGRLIDLHGYKPAFVGAGGMYVLAAGLLLSAGVLEPIRRKATGLSPSFPVS